MRINEGKWELAKGGRSVNAGREGKIRQEAGGELGNMVLVAAAPRMLKALRKVSEFRNDPSRGLVSLLAEIDPVLMETNEIDLRGAE